MGRFTKADYQRLNRAAHCDLCEKPMGRDDRELYEKPDGVYGVKVLAVHPACAADYRAYKAMAAHEAGRLIARGFELMAEDVKRMNAGAK